MKLTCVVYTIEKLWVNSAIENWCVKLLKLLKSFGSIRRTGVCEANRSCVVSLKSFELIL